MLMQVIWGLDVCYLHFGTQTVWNIVILMAARKETCDSCLLTLCLGMIIIIFTHILLAKATPEFNTRGVYNPPTGRGA